ncbi:MAG: leucine-rich repeat protein [Muribaculaceae bacterium]|nr:leucine-rich repeat protein [Muribaculaceae bacterium]
MKKILLTLVLALLATVTALAASTRTYQTINGLSFLIIKSDTGAVTVYLEGYASGYGTGATSLTIPGFIDVDDVMRPVRIDSQVFKGHASLQNITIQYGCTQIGGDAFSNIPTLRSLIIPSSVTSINGAIMRNSGSTRQPLTVAISGNPTLTTSSTTAFQDINSGNRTLITPTIAERDDKKNKTGYKEYFMYFQATPSYGPDYEYNDTYYKVTTAATAGYAGEMMLTGSLATNVTVPSTMQYMDDFCQDMPNGYFVTSVAADAAQCVGAWANLNTFTWNPLAGRVSNIHKNAFKGVTSLSSVSTAAFYIEESAFDGCTSLSSLTLGEGVRSLAINSFRSTAVQMFSLPSTTNSFHPLAFQDDAKLARVYVSTANEAYSSFNYILYDKTQTTLLLCPPNFNPNGTYTLDKDSYPWTLTKIGDYAFYKQQTATVRVPWGVTSAGESAFAYSAIKTLYLPSTLSTLGDNLLSNSTQLQDLYYPHFEVPTIASHTLGGVPTSCRIHVPAGYAQVLAYKGGNYMYRTSNYWKNFNILDDGYDYDDGTFKYILNSDMTATVVRCSRTGNVLSLTVPSSVSHVGKQFTVTAVGQRAFMSSDAVGSMTFPETVTTFMGAETQLSSGTDGAQFYGCTNLTKVKLPSRLEAVPQNCFRNTSLTDLTLPYGVKKIGSYAFTDSKLQRVLIPSSVTTVDKYCFQNCKELKELIFNKFISFAGTPAAPQKNYGLLGVPDDVSIYVPLEDYDNFRGDNYGWADFSSCIKYGGYDFIADGMCYATVVKPCEVDAQGAVTRAGEVKFVTGSYRDITWGPQDPRKGSVTLFGTVTDDWSRAYQHVALEESAFENRQLDAVVVDENYASYPRDYNIPDRAFYNTTANLMFTFPFSEVPWTSIGDNAFDVSILGPGSSSSRVSVVLARSVSSIGSVAFSNWIKEIFIPLHCTLGDNAVGSSSSGYTDVYVHFDDFTRVYNQMESWNSGNSHLNPYIDGTVTPNQIAVGCLKNIKLPEIEGLTCYGVTGIDEKGENVIIKEFPAGHALNSKFGYSSDIGNVQGVLVRGLKKGELYRFTTTEEADRPVIGNILCAFTDDGPNSYLHAEEYDYYAANPLEDNFFRIDDLEQPPVGLALVEFQTALTSNRDTLGIIIDGEPEYSKFDVNRDTAVDVGDVNAVLEAILAGSDESKFDVNGDTKVDVGDVNAILEAILAQ